MGKDNELEFIGNIINLTGKIVKIDIPFFRFEHMIPPDGEIELWEVENYASDMGVYQLCRPELKFKIYKDKAERVKADDSNVFLVTHDIALLLYGKDDRPIIYPVNQKIQKGYIKCNGVGRFDSNEKLFQF